MHWIQFHILDQLIHAKSHRFSELRAEGVESNLFQYHLRHVIKQGYVEKTEYGYRLSPKGLYFADRLSRSLRTERTQPKIISVVILQNKLSEYLLHTEAHQPFIDTYRLPAGKVHNDESMYDAAMREVREKLSIEAPPLSYAGTVHVRIRIGGELSSEYYAYLFSGEYDGSLPRQTRWFAYDPGMTQDPEIMPSVGEILSYVEAGEHEFKELEIMAQQSDAG